MDNTTQTEARLTLTARKVDGFTFPSRRGPFQMKGWGVWCEEWGCFVRWPTENADRAEQPYVIRRKCDAAMVAETVGQSRMIAIRHT